VNVDHLDALVSGLARVHDDSLRGAANSERARSLFERIVSEREHRPRVRRRFAVAAGATAVLVAAPALALRGGLTHLFASSDDAPPAVAKSFEEFAPGAPPESRISGSARLVLRVATPDGPVRVWAAPHPSGFCYAVGTAGHVGLPSTCTTRQNGLGEFVVDPFEERRKPAEGCIGDRATGSDHLAWCGYVLVGFSLNHEARSVLVRFENGQQETVPLTWISTPIDAGFFALWASQAHWLDGWERFQAKALDGSGAALDTTAQEVGTPWATEPREPDASTG
jgi:hypothetical protein